MVAGRKLNNKINKAGAYDNVSLETGGRKIATAFSQQIIQENKTQMINSC
jgi:hypothetical protein